MLRLQILLIIAIVSLTLPNALLAEAEPPCTTQKDGLTTCTLSSISGLFSAPTIALKAPLTEYRVGVVRAQDLGSPRTSVRSMAISSKATACINANFFDTRGSPLGLVISNGRTYQKMHKIGGVLTGIFSISRSGPEITHRDLFVGKDAVEATQSGPRLIEKGILTAGLKEGASYSRRSAVCLDAQNNIIFATSGGGIRGTPLNDFALLLKSAPLMCVDALNLDGGGSAQLYINSPKDEEPIFVQGNDEVPVGLCIFKRGFW